MLIYHPPLKCFDFCAANIFPIPISHRYWNFRIVFAKETWWVLNWLLIQHHIKRKFSTNMSCIFSDYTIIQQILYRVIFYGPLLFSERKRKRSRRDRLHMRFFLQIGIKTEIYCLLKQSCFTWMLSTKFSRMLLLTGTANIILMFSGEAVHCCTLLSDFLKWCWDCWWSTQRANDRYKVSYSREVCGSGSGVGV